MTILTNGPVIGAALVNVIWRTRDKRNKDLRKNACSVKNEET